MKNKSTIINILILTTILISTVTIIAVADPLDDPVVVSIEAPDTVSIGDTFEVPISIINVENLNAATFYVTFDPALISFINVTNGVIGSKTIDYCSAALIAGSENTIGVIAYYLLTQNPEDGYSSGDGYIVKINFQTISSGTCYINFSNVCQLSNYIPGQETQTIPAEWINDSVVIQEIYTITASAGPGGNINPSGTITVNHGEDKTFTITPNTGYHITNVIVDGAPVGTVTTYTFNDVTANHTIAAYFAINQYTITATAGTGGNINPPGAIPVNYGEDKTFTITPNTGYHITNVLVDGVSQGAISSYTFTNVITSHTISANFAANQYTLIINIEGQGTTNPTAGTHTYNQGEIATITATPTTGYIFHHWTGDTTGYNNPATITMNSDKTITAVFTLRGDVNCDGTVGAADITYVQQIILEYLPEIPPADVNQDEDVNIFDITAIELILWD